MGLKLTKRKMKDTWSDIQKLNNLLRSGKYPRGDDILGPGSGNFYQCVMQSALRIRALRRKTRENAQEWMYHDERIQRLMQIAGLPFGRCGVKDLRKLDTERRG